MAVLGADLLQPPPVVGQEVAEPSRRAVEGVLDQRHVPRAGIGHRLRRAAGDLLQQRAEDQRPCVIVGGISLGVVGHAESGVLEHPRAVGHPQEVIQLQQRQLARSPVERGRLERGSRAMQTQIACALERLLVAAGDLEPSHLPAEHVGPLPHGVPTHGVVQQLDHRLAERLRVADRRQHAPITGQQLLRVPVGRGHHGLAGADRIRQRPRDDLGYVLIRGDIEVGGAEKLRQLAEAHETVVEDHVLLHPQLPGQLLEAEPVDLALLPLQLRVRGPQDDVDRLGVPLDDRGQRGDGVLDALSGAEEAEGQQHVFTFHTELVLVEARVDKRHIVDAVGDDLDLVVVNAVHLSQHLGAPHRHHHQLVGKLDELVHDGPPGGIGLEQNRVQRGHHRHPQLAEQRQNVAPRGAAEDPELVLETHDVNVVDVEEFGGASIGGNLLLDDLKPDAIGILVSLGDIVDWNHKDPRRADQLRQGVSKVTGEGGNAALPRGRVAYERDPAQRWASLSGHALSVPRSRDAALAPDGSLASPREPRSLAEIDRRRDPLRR